MSAPNPTPADLIANLWHGHQSVTLRTKELQAVLLHYGGDFPFMKAGRSYNLKHKKIGPGVYSVSLEKRHKEGDE